MKEFNSQDGGRYTFIDDVVNLQNLALAFAQIFDTCDNFVISGCNLSGSAVSAGYVYINGKIREFAGGSVAANNEGNRYLYEADTNEQVPYASGGTKVGRTNYGVALANAIPSPFGEVQPQYITISSNGSCKRLNDAFFGKFALLLNPVTTTQTVRNNVTFEGLVQAAQGVLSKGSVDIEAAGGKANLFFNGTTFFVRSTINGKLCHIAMSESGIEIGCGDTVATFTNNSVSLNKPLTVSEINVGQIQLKSNNIYAFSADIQGELNINVSGTANIFQTTNIGDGKGTVLLSVIGSSKDIQANVNSFVLTGAGGGNLVFQGGADKNSITYRQYILWRDVNKESVGEVGYTSLTNNLLHIRNYIGDVQIGGSKAVNIFPAIKENGTLLSEKYVLLGKYTQQMALKANTQDVYDKESAKQLFADVASGFSQFLTHTKAEMLRQQIGAISTDDLTNYVSKNQFLADMAVTDEAKKQIRQNIGAAAVGDFQTTIKDTGWIKIGSNQLYARQIGNIVSIQGDIIVSQSYETLFTLPNQIEAPTKAVEYYTKVGGTNNVYFSCSFNANSRNCLTGYYNSDKNYMVRISITYMV